MGKGNVNKAAQKRERNAAKDTGNNQHSILKTKDQAMTIKCKICMTAFMGNSGPTPLQQHVNAKHDKLTFADCFPEQVGLLNKAK